MNDTDEPTSGLDSYTATKTLEILKDLTNEGKQVIATIHQPSSEIFEMIDELCLLSKGKIAYFGPREDVINYFANLGYQCPKYTNPADYIVNQIQHNSKFFTDAWQQNQTQSGPTTLDNLPKLKPKPRNTPHVLTQMALLLKRELNVYRRDKRPTLVRLFQIIFFSILIGMHNYKYFFYVEYA